MREVKLKHAKCIVCAHLNINSLRNKFEQLKGMIISAIDILIITETKLDDSFPPAQFNIDGFSKPYRLDRTGNGGGILIYVRDNIPSRLLVIPNKSLGIESIFIELNLRK